MIVCHYLIRRLAGCLLAVASLAVALGAEPDIHEIIRRSVAANNADWRQAPGWAFREHDVVTKSGSRALSTYEVLMLDGSDYERMLAINGHPLSPAQDAQERQKLQQEYQRRLHETQRARLRRIARYQHERQQDHMMMREMMKAFDFHLQGEGQMNGRSVYIIQALPKPGYQPPNRDTRVLTGMKGTMWIDKQTYQWVKVEAEVVQPVNFGYFIAKVGPGTKFILEEAPVYGDLWLPTHFQMNVVATILWFSHNSTDDEHYWNYRPMDVAMRELLGTTENANTGSGGGNTERASRTSR